MIAAILFAMTLAPLPEKPSHTTEILREAGRECMTMRYPACRTFVVPENIPHRRVR